MLEEKLKVDAFNNYEIVLNKHHNKIYIYVIIMLFWLLLILGMSAFYSYHPYLNVNSQVLLKNENTYLKAYIKEEDASKINDRKIFINGQSYRYKSISIGDEFVLDEKYQKYYEVLFEIELDTKYKINNNIINLNIQLPKTTIFKRIINKIKKGLI